MTISVNEKVHADVCVVAPDIISWTLHRDGCLEHEGLASMTHI